jgi:hypothetical protein
VKLRKNMKKNSKILLVLGALVLVGIGILFSIGIPQSVSGGTVLSVDNAQFLTNSPDAEGEDAFLIDVVVNKGGEVIQGEITPEMIAQYGIKQVPEGNFKVYFNLDNVSCDYQLTANQETFYKIYQATVRESMCSTRCGGSNRCVYNSNCPYDKISLQTVKDACNGKWGAKTRTYWSGDTVHTPEYCGKVFAPKSDLDNPLFGGGIAGGNCDNIVEIQKSSASTGADVGEWCWATPSQLVAGDWDGDHWQVTHIGGMPMFEGYRIGSTPSVSFTVEVIVENSKGEKVTTILSEKQTSAFLQDMGKAKFVGSLVAQEYCGQPAIEKNILKDLSTNKFKAVDRRDYEKYQDDLDTLVAFNNNYYSSNNVDPGLGFDVGTSLMSSLNTKMNSLMTQNIKDNCVVENNIYRCTPVKDLIYPELQLTLKSSWIGIIIPEGTPEIRDVELPKEILNGIPSFMIVDLENVGNELDSFDIALTCDKPISLGSLRVAVNPGEVQRVFINFVGDTGDYLCNIKASSVNNPTKTDLETISFVINARETPTVEQCTLAQLGNQPAKQCFVEAFPSCSWKCYSDEKQDYTIYLIGGAVIIALLVAYFLTRKMSGRRRR